MSQGTLLDDEQQDVDDTLGPGAAPFMGSVTGALGEWQWRCAREAAITLRRTRLPGAGDWLKNVAGETLGNTGPNGLSGTLGQFRGHLFEQLDTAQFNLRHAGTGTYLRLRGGAQAPGYDADRFVRDRFAGGVQHKLGPNGIHRAVGKLDTMKAGSAARATVRVPRDRLQEATLTAAGRVRVQGSRVTTQQVKRHGDAGLKLLAGRGEDILNPLRAGARSAAWAAVFAIGVGAAFELHRLLLGDITMSAFLAARGLEASESVVAALASFGVGLGIASVATSWATGVGTLAGIAGAVAASSLIVPVATSLVIGFAVHRVAGLLR